VVSKVDAKFCFKKELFKLVRKIQENHPTLYSNAVLRNQKYNSYIHSDSSLSMSYRKGNRANMYNIDVSARALGVECLQNNTVNGLINYEQENFFETQNDKLFETKNILGHQHFWERVDTFFKIEIQKDIRRLVDSFYKLNQDNF
jgi:hypothetical protein